MKKLFVALIVAAALFITSSVGASCSSDYDCVYGQQKCLKQAYQFSGTCVNIINEYGVQRNNVRPDAQSIYSGSQRPAFQSCPPGFSWDFEYRVCARR